MMRDTHIIVIGGGFAGVAAAARLRAGGARVTLLEARNALGGRARSDVLDDMIVDTGAQVIVSSFARTRRLLEPLGERSMRMTPGRDVYVRDGRRLPIHFGSIRSLLGFAGLGTVEKLKLAGTLLPLLARHRAELEAGATRLPPALDRQSAREYVTGHIGAHAADVLVEPPLNSFYAARGDEASLAFYLTLGRYGSESHVLAPVGGWTHLLEQLLRGVARETNARVDAIETDDGAFTPGVRVRAGERAWEGDAVVIATGPGTARDLVRRLPGVAAELVNWLDQIELRRTATLALSVDARLDHDSFGVFAHPAPGRIVSACAVYGAKLGTDAPDGVDVVLAWPTPVEAPRLAAAAADDVVSAMLPDVETLLPAVRGRVRRARVYRVEEGTPLARPGFAAHRKRGQELIRSIEAPVALAGDYLTMPLIEGAVISGEAAAERLLARLARARDGGGRGDAVR